MTVRSKLFDKNYFDNSEVGYSETQSFYDDVDWSEVASDTVKKYNEITGSPLKSFLEVGCAKGFLVKHLRNISVDAFGIDVSQYAIDTCAPEVKEFVSCQDLVNYQRALAVPDMVSLYGIIHYLNEDEIPVALNNIKGAAVIMLGQLPLSDSPETIKYWKEVDEHTVLFKGFEWYVSQFQEIGYVLDHIVWDDEFDGLDAAYFVKK